MRVAWFTHRYFPSVGGAETYGREMVQRFFRAGHDVDVLTSDAHDPSYFVDRTRRRVDSPLVSRIDGATVRRFPVKHRPLHRYAKSLLHLAPHWPTRCQVAPSLPDVPGLRRRHGPYDVVFAVGLPFTNFSYAALQTARRSGAPLILTPLLAVSPSTAEAARARVKPHEERLLQEADAIVVQTDTEAQAIAALGIHRGRTLKLGMGLETHSVTGGDRARVRSELGIPLDRLVVGQLSVLGPETGALDLIRAVALLNQTRPTDQPVHLVLGGPAIPSFERYCQESLRTLPRWLTMLGPVDPDDRADFYAALDVFAMPSRAHAYGIAILEAWANGLPVVAANAGGVGEMVDEGRTGRLVPFGQLEDLAEALAGLAADAWERRRLGQAGRAHVSEGFGWNERFAALEARARALHGTLVPRKIAG